MAWWQRLFGNRTQLDEITQQRLSALPVPYIAPETRLDDVRFVVMDQETTGLNISRDVVIAIGAVVMQQRAILMEQQFEATLYREQATQSNDTVLIHGISPDAVKSGQAPEEALLDFMEFSDNCIYLAYHAPFDQHMLQRALKADLGYALKHPFIDVADIAGALVPEAGFARPGLDDWVNYFRLEVSERHHAAADALVTAEITLVLFAIARRQGIVTLGQLDEKIRGWKRLHQLKHH